MHCPNCYEKNDTPPGYVGTIQEFDNMDTHARYAKYRNGIVKCDANKMTACSVKSVLPNNYDYADKVEGPEVQPTSCLYDLSGPKALKELRSRGVHGDNVSLLNSAYMGETVRFHRLWPATGKWVFCGYYFVHLLTPSNKAVVRLTKM